MKVPRSKLHVLPWGVALIVFIALLGCSVWDAGAVNPGNSTGGTAEGQQESPAQPAEATPPSPPPSTSPTTPSAVNAKPGGSVAAKDIQESLLRSDFAYSPRSLQDPFKPFIAPAETAPTLTVTGEEDLETPPEPQRPLTPLQKMRISEIEAGLKAIMWGPMGRKAVIEDASGKGYIVSVGTPAGERNGVVTEIFNDHLVIQQEYWDKKERRVVPQNSTIKLKKGKSEPLKP